MKIEWIKFTLIFLTFDRYICTTNVSININLDLLSNETILKVYEGPNIAVSRCPDFLSSSGNVFTVFLNVSKNLQNSICDTIDVKFFVFVYYTNITSALVTVVNNEMIFQMLKQDRDKIVILNRTNNYITFVECQNSFLKCRYNNVNQRVSGKNYGAEVYSDCKNNTNCITNGELLPELKSPSNDTLIGGSTIIIKRSIIDLKPNPNLFCKNGGSKSGSKNLMCKCPENDDFIERGPLCEALQLSLTNELFLRVLPNTDELNVELSLFSPAFQSNIEILRIEKDSNVIKYSIFKNSEHVLTVKDQNISFIQTLDRNAGWINIFISISKSTTTFRINEKEESKNVTVDLNLDTVPLILANKYSPGTSLLCIGNLKINYQIIDLYVPNYNNCQPSCGRCKPGSKCFFEPFKSESNTVCICQNGYINDTASKTCVVNDDNVTVSIKNNEVSNPITMVDTKDPSIIIQFEFRTLSADGKLVSFNSLDSTYKITLEIISQNIFVTLMDSKVRKTAKIDYYSVSDGQWHFVSMKVESYIFEITLDENIQYYYKKIFFDKGNAVLRTVHFGPLTNNNFFKSAHSTCIRSLTIVPNKDKASFTDVPLKSSLTLGCDSGKNCSDLNCPSNELCVQMWQNTSCVCFPEYIKPKDVCVYRKCEPNPCKNEGICFYNMTNNNFQCNCTNGVADPICESTILKGTFYWWIILIVLLVLLIIIIIVVICLVCLRKYRGKQKNPDIGKIHEDTMAYNEQAGEVDYHGPPIKYNLFNYGLPAKVPKAPLYPPIDFEKPKQIVDMNNKDLILDHPLDYGYEGEKNDDESISSLGSNSTDEQLDVKPIEKTNDKFKYLKNLYK